MMLALRRNPWLHCAAASAKGRPRLIIYLILNLLEYVEMKFSKTIATLALIAAAVPAVAAQTTIDFEGTGSFGSILEFYNGGVDAAGNSGANYGVSFTGSAMSLSNDATTQYFSHAPTPGTIMFVADQTAFMNVADGFTNSVSLYYSSIGVAANAVNIYSGLNGSGDLLGSFSLSDNAQSGCSDTFVCNFDQSIVTFSGTGKSIAFNSGVPAGYDNVSITPVPEPTTYALMMLGLAGIGMVARRRRSV